MITGRIVLTIYILFWLVLTSLANTKPRWIQPIAIFVHALALALVWRMEWP